MDPEELVERVRVRAGFERAAEAEGALLVVLEVVATAFDDGTRAALADALPGSWSVLVRDAREDPSVDREGVARLVADHERVRPGFGREHTLVVCQVLAEEAEPDLRRRLQGLPRGIGAMFDPRAVTEGGPERLAAPHERQSGPTTLSSGRSGSSHPVSDSAPAPGQRNSVAGSEDPHGDTKISSAEGTTQERQGRTLAEGRPGSDRPLSEED